MALCCSCASPEVVVLASGSRLVVVTREDHRVRWEMALEAEVGAAYFPLATVSINVTAITLQVLRSKTCHRLLLEECDGYRSAPDPLDSGTLLRHGRAAAWGATTRTP